MSAQAEKDIAAAVIKFSEEWKEEDCRSQSARGQSPSPARVTRKTAPQYKDDQKVGNIPGDHSRVENSEGDQTVKQAAMVTTDVMDCQMGPAFDQQATMHNGPNTVQEAHPKSQRVNPELQALTLLSSHTMAAHPSGACDPLETSCSPAEGTSPLMKAPPQLLPLSPISEVAKRMTGVSLKRQADDPESPSKQKRRRLFNEPSEERQEIKLPKATPRKKNIRKVKKEIREKRSSEVSRGVVSKVTEEIDFPAEWKILHGSETAEQGPTLVNEGSGGCPPTATPEP